MQPENLINISKRGKMMIRMNRNTKLFTSAALSLMIAFQGTLPVYAMQADQKALVSEASKKDTAKDDQKKKAVDVKVVLVSKDTHDTIAVLSVNTDKDELSVLDLKMPKGVKAADSKQTFKVSEDTPAEVECTSDNKQTVLNITWNKSGEEAENENQNSDEENKPEKFTQQVNTGKNIEFVEGLNFEVPEGYVLAKDQNDDFKKAFDEKDKAIDVEYGKELNLEANIVREALINVQFVEDGQTIGSIVLKQSEEKTSEDEEGNIVFDLTALQAPDGYEITDTLTKISVAPEQSQDLSVNVKSAQEETPTDQQTPADSASNSQTKPDSDKNNAAKPNKAPENKQAESIMTITYKADGKEVGKQELKVSGTDQTGWTLQENQLEVPEGYQLDQDSLRSKVGPYVYGQNFSIELNVTPVSTPAPEQPGEPEKQQAVINVVFRYPDGKEETAYTETVEFTEGQTYTVDQARLNIPQGYEIDSMPAQAELSAGDNTFTVVLKEITPAPEQPTVPETVNADLVIVYKTADGTIVGEKQTITTQLENGTAEQVLDASKLQIPAGYEISGSLPEMKFIASQTPEYTVVVKKIAEEPQLKQAVLKVTYKNRFEGNKVGTSTSTADQKTADEKDASFGLSSLQIPAGYVLSNNFENISVPFGEEKEVTLDVTANGNAVVVFTDNGQIVGQSYQYYFEQTEKGQKNASLKVSDLSVPDGYELDVNADTVYEIPLGTGQATQISVPVKAKNVQKEALAVLRIQYYIQSGSNRQIVGTQSIDSPAKGLTDQKYTFDFDSKYKLEVPKGYKLKSKVSLGRVDMQYGTMGTIQIEVIRDVAHTSTETNWPLYAGIGAAALVAAGILFFVARKKKD